MKLMKRLNKLMTADAHAVIDSMEEPYALLKQAMRDMESVIQEQDDRLNRTINSIGKLQQQSALYQKEQTCLDQDLDLCFESGKEELARTVIKKKLYLKQRVSLNKQSLTAATDKQSELEQLLQANKEKYQLIAQQARIVLTQRQADNQTEDLDALSPSGAAITEDEIEMALLNEKSRREIS
ncbi:MAG: hypothetical protein GY951_02015 [Psychromonas sp.]|nr:hypothetical protein [Alteromonadales bacterium]MCP5076821.1 hypothetical protein [Psychromonas sp.]